MPDLPIAVALMEAGGAGGDFDDCRVLSDTPHPDPRLRWNQIQPLESRQYGSFPPCSVGYSRVEASGDHMHHTWFIFP
jgi:hypothetical protein